MAPMSPLQMLFLLIAITVQRQEAPKASIEGTVVVVGSGRPVPNAQVTLFSSSSPGTRFVTPSNGVPGGGLQSGTTDNQGRFAFGNLDAGSFVLEAAANGF